MIKVGVWLLFWFATPSIFADRLIGNGGDVIFCEDKTNIHHLKMYDEYEAQVLRREQIQWPSENLDLN